MLAVIRHRKSGLTMAEIIMAIGFLAVFTTGLLAIATKGFELSGKEVDSAYQHCESLMESYSHEATRGESWTTIVSTDNYQFPVRTDQDGNQQEDRHFCYEVESELIGTELKKVQVKVFVANSTSTDPAPDTALPKGGEVLRMTNFYPRP